MIWRTRLLRNVDFDKVSQQVTQSPLVEVVLCSTANDDDDDDQIDKYYKTYECSNIEMNERIEETITPLPGCRASQKR